MCLDIDQTELWSEHYITGKIIFHMLNRTNINSAKYSLINTDRLAQQKQFVAQIQQRGGGYLLKTYTHYNAPYTPTPRIKAINMSHHFICICTLYKQRLSAPRTTSCSQLLASLISQHKTLYCDLTYIDHHIPIRPHDSPAIISALLLASFSVLQRFVTRRMRRSCYCSPLLQVTNRLYKNV